MYTQILIAVSLLLATYQDFKDRAVLDVIWLPALVGVAYSVAVLYPDLIGVAVKLGLVGVVCFLFVIFGLIGQADAVALVLVAADPISLSPLLPLVATGLAAAVHIGYEYAVGNARGVKTIPLEQFVREKRWIPRAVNVGGARVEVDQDVNVARDQVEKNYSGDATVEVQYGVPTVAYLGIGYAAYLVYLIVFQPGTLTAFP